jgi:hypothetical protein
MFSDTRQERPERNRARRGVRLSFLPLEVYVRASLAEEFDFDATALPDRVTADAFTTALQPLAKLTTSAAEHTCGLYLEPP